MKYNSLRFKITSQDSEVQFQTEAEFKNNRIKFVDNDGVMNYVILKDNIVEYYKKGEIDMKYKFDLDKVTKGHYKIIGTEFVFDIVTNILQMEEDGLYIEYDLYQSSDLVNQTKLTLVYETKEES